MFTLMRRYRKDIPEFWSRRPPTALDTARGQPELRVA